MTDSAGSRLFMTVSLYVPASRLKAKVPDWLQVRRKLRSAEESPQLRRAVDPMFNDISARGRANQIDEFLIDVPGESGWTERITMPGRIPWSTEDTQFSVQFPNTWQVDAKAQAFWYAFPDGGLSYNLSLAFDYAHEMQDFFAISLLQKAVVPSELLGAPCPKNKKCEEPWINDWPIFHDPRKLESEQPTHTFWGRVRELFESHAGGLHSAKDFAGSLWDLLLKRDVGIDPSAEQRNQALPTARCMFVFRDPTLFEMLGKPRRTAMIAVLRDRENSGAPNPYLKETGPKTYEVEVSQSCDDALRYYFFSGFVQNIIDFFNQDSSEIGDDTDPLYPTNETQEGEAQFIRYANTVSLYQVVRSSRTLEFGANYLGTCPYLFLTHIMALNNELLARELDRDLADEMDRLDAGSGGLGLREILRAAENSIADNSVTVRDLHHVTSTFYSFRYEVFSRFTKYLYADVFRYDTERDFFTALQACRSATARLEACFEAIDRIDKTIDDLDDNIRYFEQLQAQKQEEKTQASDRRLNQLFGVIATVSGLQLAFTFHDFCKDADRDVAVLMLSLLVAVALSVAVWVLLKKAVVKSDPGSVDPPQKRDVDGKSPLNAREESKKKALPGRAQS